MTRGQPVIEALLESGIPYLSGPEWLAREVLKDRWVLAVAGTHGKTTTASLLAWILEHAGLEPGFLIGGVPANFGLSARLGAAPFFVIEADEYDTAFFDKRAKFVHYRPRTVILNNLEYDHADIYPDLAAIQRQFHHLVRIVPGGGRIVWNAADANLKDTLAMGCWTPLEGFARTRACRTRCGPALGHADYSRFEVFEGGQAARQCRMVADRRAQHGERARGDRRRAPRRGRRAAGDRGARGFPGHRAAHAAARRGRTACASTMILRITRRRSPPRSMACAGASGTRASSRCSSRARTPCAWACTGTRSPPRSRARMRCGCTRRPTWAGIPARS